MSEENALRLGLTLECGVTGFRGVAMTKVDQYSGNIRYVLQPRVDNASREKYPAAMELDQHTLVVVPPEKVLSLYTPTVIEPVDESGIQLGQEVEEIASGFRGIAMERLTHLNGCVFYDVVTHVTDEGIMANAMPGGTPIDAKRLKIVSEGIREDVNKIVTESAKAPGGPATVGRNL